MPMVAWNTYLSHLPTHVREDTLRETTVTAFPYMDKKGRGEFLRRLEGATSDPGRRLGKEEYQARVASIGHIKMVEVSKGEG